MEKLTLENIAELYELTESYSRFPAGTIVMLCGFTEVNANVRVCNNEESALFVQIRHLKPYDNVCKECHAWKKIIQPWEHNH